MDVLRTLNDRLAKEGIMINLYVFDVEYHGNIHKVLLAIKKIECGTIGKIIYI